MYYFGDPDFYNKHIKGMKFWPSEDKTNQPPTTKEELHAELAKLKAKRIARRQTATTDSQQE